MYLLVTETYLKSQASFIAQQNYHERIFPTKLNANVANGANFHDSSLKSYNVISHKRPNVSDQTAF